MMIQIRVSYQDLVDVGKILQALKGFKIVSAGDEVTNIRGHKSICLKLE